MISYFSGTNQETGEEQKNEELKDLSTLDTCVTVVDASTFQSYFESKDIALEHSDDKAICQV